MPFCNLFTERPLYFNSLLTNPLKSVNTNSRLMEVQSDRITSRKRSLTRDARAGPLWRQSRKPDQWPHVSNFRQSHITDLTRYADG